MTDTVLDKWQLVPKRATKEMLDAVDKAYDDFENATEATWLDARSVYDAMLAAAPTPPALPVAKSVGIPNDVPEDLRLGAVGIRTWMPETLPANEQGQVHFARAIAEAAAEAIEKAIDRYWSAAYQQGKSRQNHDTPEGSAQDAEHSLKQAIVNALAQAEARGALEMRERVCGGGRATAGVRRHD